MQQHEGTMSSVWSLCVVSRYQALQSCLSNSDCDLMAQALYPSIDQTSASETTPKESDDGAAGPANESAHLER